MFSVNKHLYNIGSYFIDTLRNEMKSEITVNWCYLFEIEIDQE